MPRLADLIKSERVGGGMTDADYAATLFRAQQQKIPEAFRAPEPGLQGGVPTENVTGLGLSPLDLIGTGLGTKAATLGGSMLAALAGTAIASKASKGARLSELAMSMPSQRGIFAGVGAKTANREALAKAEQLKSAGVPDEQIWKETGWTFGFPDQKPRFEIPDNAAKFREVPRENISNTMPVDRAYQHDDLYSAYPELRDTKINFQKGNEGSYLQNENLIKVGTGDAPYPFGITGHELQHAIQQREGFARGGSPEGMAAAIPLNELDLNSAQLIQRRIARGDTPSEAARWLKETLGHDVSPQIMDAAMQKNILLSPYDQYKRLAGEAEARLTQARMSMTPEQRLANYPVSQFDVPVDQQIVRYK